MVASGSASAAIALTAGTAKTITVTATEAGKTAKTYTIEVTRSPAPAITVTAPAGSTTHYQGSSLTVSWTTDPAPTAGEFGVWARSAANDYYIAKPWAAGGGTSFSTFLVLDVPAGAGYRAVVGWRPTAGSGGCVSFATSPGSFIVTASPPPPPPPGTYIITASAGDHGSISPSGAVSVAAGADQPFTITANYGFHIASVTVDNVSQGAISSYTFTSVTASHTITATFAQASP